MLPFARPLSRRKLPIRPRYWAPAWFEIDGANSVDMWGRQTIFANIPLMAVDEMSVPTNAFTPEYGGGTGSVVNLVTRSGGSNYHGQLLELWRPAATEASLSGFTTTNAASGNDITSDTLDQTALAVSGPLLSQKSTSSSPANGTARPRLRPLRRRSRRAALSATIAGGSVWCAWWNLHLGHVPERPAHESPV